MRFINIIYAIFVAIVAAQTQQNYINVPEGGFGTITAVCSLWSFRSTEY